MPDADDIQGLDEAEAIQRFRLSPISMVLTDPTLEDNPIVFANAAFFKMTGYDRSDVLGRNCRFLQGDLDPKAQRRRLRTAIDAREEITLDIRNKRADGTEFTNHLMVAPIFDGEDCVHFIGLQMAQDDDGEFDHGTDLQLRELQHRVKNHLSMIIALVRQQSRESQSPEDFQALARRIEALQVLYEEMTNGSDDDIPMGSYLSRIASAIGHIDGRAGIRMQIEIETVSVPLETATAIGMILSELLTNAFQHGFRDRSAGQIEVRVSRLSDGALRMLVADDGVGMPEECSWPDSGSLGGRLVNAFVNSMNASLDVRRGGTGTLITVDVPAESNWD